MNKHISILILAAGASTRMQRVKQLLPWGKHSLIEHVVNNANSSKAKKCYLLLGSNIERIRPLVQNLQVETLENKKWDQGLGKSISVGVEAILKKEDPDAILIILGDQPFVDETYLNKLIESFLDNEPDVKIVGTKYKNKIGVPAVFSSKLFEDLTTLDSHNGASGIIEDNLQYTIAIDPLGKERDMDTWDEYIKIRPV